jgi:hypothetical protein
LQAPKHPKALQNQAVDAGSIPGASSTNPLTSQRNFPRQVEWTRFGSESPAEIALMIETKRCAYVIDTGLVYLVYKSPTAIFTRSRVRLTPQRSGQALSVEVRRGCGEGPGAAARVAGWVNETVDGVD